MSADIPGSPAPRSNGPLTGLRVLDLSRVLAGPMCAQTLGDYGADIIKIEKPGAGDDTRQWGPHFVRDKDGNKTRESAYYLCANRNKRSVAVDLAAPEGAAIIRQLARHCDIVLENFKVGGLEKYGLDAASLRAEHPGLIYCSITGYGQTGPNAKKPGYDLMAQAFGGMMSVTGEPDGEPMKVGVAIADIVCGLQACTAILAALHHRHQTGEGQHIDIGLVDSQISWLANQATNYFLSGEPPIRYGNEHPNIVPYQVFQAADGHVIVAVGNDRQFAGFCNALDQPELAADPRFITNDDRGAHRDEIQAILKPAVAAIAKAELVEALSANGVPGGVINSVPEVFETSQVAAREMKVSVPHSQAGSGTVDLVANPVKFSSTPVTYRYGPPTCGEHTDEVLAELPGA